MATRDVVKGAAQSCDRSKEFLDLSASYRDVRRRDIDRLLRQNDGTIAKVPFKDIEAKHVQPNRRQLTLIPANERPKTWRALFAFAIAGGIVAQDQSKDEKKRKRKGKKKRPGHLPWKLSEIEKYRAYCPYGTAERAMFEVLYWVGT